MRKLELRIRDNWVTKDLQGNGLTLLVEAMNLLTKVEYELVLLNDIQMYMLDVQLSTLEGTEELIRVSNQVSPPLS